MKSRKFQFHIYFRDGFKNVCNHIFMSFSSILTLVITLTLSAVVVLFVVNANSFTVDIESQITLMVEMEYYVSPSQINAVKNMLDDHPMVAGWDFVDRETGHQNMTEMMAVENDVVGEILEGIENPLVDVFHVEAVNIDSLNSLQNFLERHPDIQFVHHPADAADTISGVTNAIRILMTVFAGVLMLLAVFLIHNTIKITIYSRREELGIMRLVGASVGHITWPFLIEGLIIGIIGAIVPILFTLLGYALVYDITDGIFAINLFQLVNPTPLIYQIGFTMGIISIVVSLLGSLFAVGRHALKE